MFLHRLASAITQLSGPLRITSISSGCKSRMMTSNTSSSASYDFANSPYRLSNVFTVREHVPPTEIKFNYTYMSMQDPEYNKLMKERDLPLEERYHKHPPIETEPPGTQKLPLKIIRHLRVSQGRAAQLVLAEVPGSISKAPLVAKFYDPFYYDHVQDDVEPFRMVDYDYHRETLAYRYLNNEVSITPRYYGSYTCEFPMSKGNRAVRLILMEYIKGICMETLDPNVLSRAARQNIMEKVVRAESNLYARRFNHRDVFARNFMVQCKSSTFEDKDLEVKMIDLTTSLFGWEIETPERDGAVSPIVRWHEKWVNIRDDFTLRGWIDWDWQPWLEKCFEGDPTFMPVTEEQKRQWLIYYLD